jgi:CRISPR/Cas system-associated exonuclease Cas4 (RecB family)
MIYDALQAEQGQREVSIEDLIRTGCGYRHYLHLKGTERKRAERPQELLVRQHAMRVRIMIDRYLQGCYGKEYTTGAYVTHGDITVLIDGVLKGALVDIQVISDGEYSSSRAPRKAVLSAAVKAHLDGRSEALLILINRNNQEWSFWSVGGDLPKVAKEVLHDAAYVTSLTSGDASPMGMASRNTCRVCPYAKACTMEPTDDPSLYSISDLRVVPAMLERTQVENYLWSLNDEPNERATKVIHPSSFSTSKCDRRIGYDLQGIDQNDRIDPRLRRIFDAGHALHDVVQRALDMAVKGFEPEVTVSDESLKIYGHCDGRLTATDGLEIKSISSKGFATLKKAKPEHEIQATLYGAILGFERIHYVYVNKETGDIAAYEVPVSRKIWHKQAARASNIVKTVELGNLPPKIEQDYICKRCPYAWHCRSELGTTATEQQKRTFT